jgi:propanediol dehydratase large subunit
MNNSTTLQAITGMSFSVITGGQYWVEGILAVNAAVATNGIKFGFTGITASDVYALTQYRIVGNSNSRTDFETTMNPIVEFVETTAVGSIALNMTFTADTGGTMQFGFAQSVAGVTNDAQLRKGSSLRLTKMS